MESSRYNGAHISMIFGKGFFCHLVISGFDKQSHKVAQVRVVTSLLY